ncbi:conserved protein of unknown function [Burkholderia multivorans]
MDFRSLSTREELIAYLQANELSGLDSEYSPTMSVLMERFGAKGIHVNRWWVMTSVDWRCPACGRGKAEIVKLDRHRYLAGQLHEHHDHMKDLVRKRFYEEAVRRKIVVADVVAERFAVRTAFGLSAYDNTIICADCNRAEGRAKRLAKTHRDFSFSPGEIRQFVDPVSNQGAHKIRVEIARRIWEASRKTFVLRLAMVNRVARLAASNDHWYQPSDATALTVERSARQRFAWSGLYELSRKIGFYDGVESLLYTPIVHRGNASSWRFRKAERPTAVPTEQNIELLRRIRGKYWDRVDEFWCCPCCARTRFQCLRPGKQSPWIFDIKEKVLFDLGHGRVPLCEDCSNVASHLAREVAELAGVELLHPSSILALGELRSVIRAQPHIHHNIDNEQVEALLPALERRLLDIAWESEWEEDVNAE